MAGVIVFYPPVREAVYTTFAMSADYRGYDPFIRHIREWGMVTRPNFLYPLLIFVIQSLTGATETLGIQLIVSLAFWGLLAAVLQRVLEFRFGVPSDAGTYVKRLALILALMVLAPVSIVPLRNHNLYFGYIGITVYHNANMALVRPLAVLHFWLTLRLLVRPEGLKRSTVFGWLPLLAACVTLIKPNYALAMVPALCIWIVASKIAKSPVGTREIIFGVVLPFVAVLGWQYAFTYINPNPDIEVSQTVFWPFASYRSHSLDLIPKFLLSIVFPVTLAALFGRRLWADKTYAFTWLVFFVGLFFNYGLAETGWRLSHGNFWWTGQITLFLLIITSIIALIRLNGEGVRQWKIRICWAAFGLHVASGAVWYYCETVSSGASW